jgi:multiple sugar transport system permease protein
MRAASNTSGGRDERLARITRNANGVHCQVWMAITEMSASCGSPSPLWLPSYNWLGDPELALVSVIAIHTWQWTPFAFLVMLASLSSLPPDVFEAARIDRASAWQRFRHITLPLIRPAIVIVVIMRTMIALSAFAAIFAATGGGPGTATEILNLYAYRTSFSELNLGYGAALAMVLLAITLGVSSLMFRVRRAR